MPCGVRGAALSHQLLVPRRCQPPRGAGRRSRPARASPRLAVTDHNGFYGIVRFAVAANRWGCPRSSATELTLTARRRASERRTPPRGARRRAGRPRPAGRVRSAEASSRERRRRPASTSPRSPRGPALPCTSRATSEPSNEELGGAHRVSPGRSTARAHERRSRRGTRASSTGSSSRSGGTACSWSCGTTATRSTGTATTPSPPSPRRGRRRGRHQQRPLRHARAPAARHRARGHPRPAARSTRWTGTSPRARSRTCAARESRRAGSPAGRARSSARSRSRSSPRSTCGSPHRTSPTRGAHRPHRHGVAARAHPARRRAALPVDPPAARAGHRQIAYELDVIDQLGFPGYFLVLVDIVEFCRREDIYCQGRGSAAEQRGVLRARCHQGRRRRARAAVRALPLPRA